MNIPFDIASLATIGQTNDPTTVLTQVVTAAALVIGLASTIAIISLIARATKLAKRTTGNYVKSNVVPNTVAGIGTAVAGFLYSASQAIDQAKNSATDAANNVSQVISSMLPNFLLIVIPLVVLIAVVNIIVYASRKHQQQKDIDVPIGPRRNTDYYTAQAGYYDRNDVPYTQQPDTVDDNTDFDRYYGRQ